MILLSFYISLFTISWIKIQNFLNHSDILCYSIFHVWIPTHTQPKVTKTKTCNTSTTHAMTNLNLMTESRNRAEQVTTKPHHLLGSMTSPRERKSHTKRLFVVFMTPPLGPSRTRSCAADSDVYPRSDRWSNAVLMSGRLNLNFTLLTSLWRGKWKVDDKTPT